MKKIFILLILILAGFLSLTAHPVDQKTAQVIAAKFMGTNDMYLSTIYHTNKNDNAFYIFNTSKGFVIVSADDCETPIIGYSHEGRFDPNNVPVQMEDYLRDFVARIQYGIENHIVADETTAKQWHLVKATGRLNNKKNAKAVEPLITARWHQGCLYNSLCPTMENTPCGHAEVGCVAVAMAQIMHYWKFPEGGFDSHSYFFASTNSVLSANFGNTIYNWGLMPDSLTDASNDTEINAVATLLFHCGVSIDMMYSPSGSEASDSDVPYALTHYFKYSNVLYLDNANDDMAEWLYKLKNSLDLQRPILYSGRSGSGHAFVCDGYDGNDMLHFNWGWGGNGDGYYALGSLNPLGHNYSSYNKAILNITPNYELHSVSASANPPESGYIEGNGRYHCGQQCFLTAIPSGDYHFHYWTRGNNIVSYDSVYSLFAMNDINDIEAVFTLRPVTLITASEQYFPDDPNNPCVSLSWENRNDDIWPLIKTFGTTSNGIATDGNFIYTCIPNVYQSFRKYSMNGNLLETFHVNGCQNPTCLTSDGVFFYCNELNEQKLHKINMATKKKINDIAVDCENTICSYDSVNNGLWLCRYDNQQNAYKLRLVKSDGLTQLGPTLPSYINPVGLGFIVDSDGSPHLLIKSQTGQVYHYDINYDLFNKKPLKDFGTSSGCCVGQFGGKNALFVCHESSVKVYEIPIMSLVPQIFHFRLYRYDENANTVMVADSIAGTSYIDSTWKDASSGKYCYGISAVSYNGSESKIVWSNVLTKTNFGINEYNEPKTESAQKIIKNGHLFILVNGKKYSVTGQVHQ